MNGHRVAQRQWHRLGQHLPRQGPLLYVLGQLVDDRLQFAVYLSRAETLIGLLLAHMLILDTRTIT